MEHAIIAETIESLKEYVPKLVAASEKIAQDIQKHEGGWADTLVAYLEGVAWLTMAVNGINQLNEEILHSFDLNAFAPLIEQMGAALEQEDLVTVCDLLQFEIQPFLRDFDTQLNGMVH
jgi:hypothetical protein